MCAYYIILEFRINLKKIFQSVCMLVPLSTPPPVPTPPLHRIHRVPFDLFFYVLDSLCVLNLGAT